MRRAALVCLLLFGCGGDDGNGDTTTPDAYVPNWWMPAPGETKNWDVQLAAPFEVSPPRDMYMLPLFALSPGGSIMEADGSMVTVPAGALAGKLAELHGRTPPSIVVCAIGTGTIRLDDPDAMKFPGYKANPPDSPTVPEPGSVIGWSATSPMERHLDIRAATRSAWLPLIDARYDFAKTIGCDAIMPDGNDSRLGSGFDATIDDQQSLYEVNAAAVHDRELSVGQRKDIAATGQTDALQPLFDWVVPERCAEANNCASARPYVNAHKAAFAIEFTFNPDAMTGTDAATACPRLGDEQIFDGLLKDDLLTSAVREQCP